MVPQDGQGRTRDAQHFDVSHRQLLKLAYLSCDKDGDGELERCEVEAMLSELGFRLDRLEAQQIVQSLFEQHDTGALFLSQAPHDEPLCSRTAEVHPCRLTDPDGNGMIEFEEFEAIFAGICKAMAKPENSCTQFDVNQQQLLRIAYAKFDVDGDGELERTEVVQMMEKMGFNLSKKGMSTLVDDLWSQYDTDGNGTIDFGEFGANRLDCLAIKPAARDGAINSSCRDMVCGVWIRGHLRRDRKRVAGRLQFHE
eukprot:SAG31_NODE_5799_length_2323_cov_1.375899_3_plen_253_part_01